MTGNIAPTQDLASYIDRCGRSAKWLNGVFSGLGMLLLVAAALKTHQAYSEPMSSFAAIGLVAIICFEVCLGTWLVLGTRTLWTWYAAVVCFAAFATFSGYKAFLGESSCGCFGTATVDPRVTLGIDVLAVVSLLFCRRDFSFANRPVSDALVPRFLLVSLTLSLMAMAVSVLGQSRFTQSDGPGTVAGQFVLLAPDSWIGKRWPLLSESGLKLELAVGKWDVLLFRHDCHVCHDVMLELEQILATRSDKRRIALIGIDEPRDDVQIIRLHKLGCIIGHLPQDREWFVTTPVRLFLEDGECVSSREIDRWDEE